MLRHPVVITSLQEDLEKIGLAEPKPSNLDESYSAHTVGKMGLPASQGGEVGSGDNRPVSNGSGPGTRDGYSVKSGGSSFLQYTVGGDELNVQDSSRMDSNHDYGTTEDEDDVTEEQVAAYEEAVEFAETFDDDFDSCDEDTEISLSQEQMAELSSMGEATTLSFDVLNLDEDDDADDDDDDDDDVEEGFSLEALLGRIEEAVGRLESGGLEDRQEAIRAFANLALVADKLEDEFAEVHSAFPEHGADKLEGAFGEMAAQAAAIAENLDSGREADGKLLEGTFNSMLEDLMQGLDIYTDIQEDTDDEEVDEDDDMVEKFGKMKMKMMKGKKSPKEAGAY